MFLHGSTNRRCFSGEYDPGEPPSYRWTTETDGAIWSSPAVADGTLYVGSYDEHLYAMSADDGEVLWRYEVGDRLDGSPAVVDGTVYVGAFDRNIYALDAETGAERWVYGTEGIVRSSPTVVDGVVYIGAHCRTTECSNYYDVAWPERGAVYAIDARTGDVRWRYEADDGVVSTPTVDGGTVFVGGSDNHLYALDAETGRERWRFDTDDRVIASPTVVDGRLYAGNLGGKLYAVDTDVGELRWRFDSTRSGDDGVAVSAVVTSSPVVCDGGLYVGTTVPEADGTYGTLYALDADEGTVRWSASPFGQSLGSSPVVVGGTLFFGAHDLGSGGESEPGVFAVDTEGAVQWGHTVGRDGHMGFGSSPAVVGSTLYIEGTDGSVYAFDLEGFPEE
jgi:outer membrane protein assembly factor BamB